MAHFVELDENNNVLRTIVVSNEDCSDSNGIESEEIGIGFCKKLFGSDTIWKQTSYNHNIRYNYAYPGCYYDEQNDAFITPKPYDSWVLDMQTFKWVSPIGYPPEEGPYVWDENEYQKDNTKGWISTEHLFQM